MPVPIPRTVLSDLAEFNHLVTRLRFRAGGGQRTPRSRREERVRGLDFAQTLPVRVLSRSWQMLLKGIAEVQTAARPIDAAEMVLIRIAHAADLPTAGRGAQGAGRWGAGGCDHCARTACACKQWRQWRRAGDRQCQPAIGWRTAGPNHAAGAQRGKRAIWPLRRRAEPEDQPGIRIASLADIAALADQKRDLAFKVLVKRCVRPGEDRARRLEIVGRPMIAPRTLVGDLGKKLQEWTGRRWVISVSSEKGGPTLAETEGEGQARIRRWSMRAAIRRWPPSCRASPGARIIDVRLPDLVAESEETEPPVETDIDDDGSL